MFRLFRRIARVFKPVKGATVVVAPAPAATPIKVAVVKAPAEDVFKKDFLKVVRAVKGKK